MPKKAAIVKSCPKCDHNVAVASKSCKCGHSFFHAKRSSVRTTTRSSIHSSGGGGGSSSLLMADTDDRRRTSRVRREKPNYYDSQEFDKKKKKKDRRGRPTKQLCQPDVPAPKIENHKESTAARAKRRRLRKEQEDGGGDICAKLSLDKQQLASIILAEINRKMNSVVWSPT